MRGFWETKNLDFRTFFDVFSKSFLKRVSKRQKIGPSRPKDGDDGFLEVDSGGPPPRGFSIRRPTVGGAQRVGLLSRYIC